MKTLYQLLSCTIVLLCAISTHSISQNEMSATRMDESMKIDGILNENSWASSEIATDFIAWRPNPGEDATHNTQVRVLYDDEAMYIGATLFVNNKDSIARELTQRDDIGNTDWFGVVIDTYGNGRDGFEFIVGATGVQFDAKVTETMGEDTNWDAVWFSSVQIKETDWTVELKIPYAAIRFANKPVQTWRVNFMRNINGLQEKSSWNFIDPQVNGFLTQNGQINGLENIKSPIRLSVSPYLSLYAQNSNNGEVSSTGFSYNGGMDLKYGISDAFTLDMTLIPDFGQVRSDDVVLNLSPFEVRFDENRQFFTEGLELFDQQDLFYSRRVGGTPIGYYSINSQMHEGEKVIDNSSTAQLYNASKISGRTANGLGVGIFNAISRETNAILENIETREQRRVTTSPLTNFNILVLDQNLANNSSVSLMNTNVWRQGNSFHDANVTSLGFDIKNKAQSYNVFGRGVLSQIINPEGDNRYGHNVRLGVGKISGNTGFNLSYREIGQGFDSNDLGFLFRKNYRRLSFFGRYSAYEEFGPFNRGNFWTNVSYERQIEPNSFATLHFNGGFWMQAKSFWSFNMWANFRPEGNDFNEPRVFGRFYKYPSWYNVGYWMETDNRKPFYISGYFDIRNVREDRWYEIAYNIEPRYRVSNQFTFGWDTNVSHTYSERGFATFSDNNPLFGERDRTTITNTIRANYTINDLMGLDFRLRHYWSKVQYSEYLDLQDNGYLIANTEYDGFNDRVFNAFNIDLNYRWRFSPGSDIIINWKNSIAGSMQDAALDYNSLGYRDGIQDLSELPQTNSLSVRIVYFLDYLSLKNAF